MDANEMLDRLEQLARLRDELAERERAIIDGLIPPDVKAEIEAVQEEIGSQIEAVSTEIDKLEKALKQEVLSIGRTISNERVSVQYVRGRMSFDKYGLLNLANKHPEIRKHIKRGRPYATIRYRRDKK